MFKVALELQPCLGQRSGIGTYTYELASRLNQEAGLRFYGNVFDFGGRNNIQEQLKEVQMPIRQCKMVSYGLYRRLWHLLTVPYQSMFSPEVDLTIFFDYIVPPHIWGKTITTIHDLTFLRYPEMMQARNRKRIDKDIYHSLERSSRVITISEFSKQELIKLMGVPEDKISVVYNAPSTSKKYLDFPRLANKYKIRNKFILYVGTIEPRKNIVRLLKAFERLKSENHIPHQLVLAGGSGWNNGEIYHCAQELRCREDVIFTGYVSSEEKNTLYRSADVFVFPSLYEGFGIPPLEAMVHECPVVCANTASLPEVVGDAGEYVDPLDENCIAQGIWNVISNAAYKASLIECGKMRCKKFSWDISAKKLQSICYDVLNE